MYFTQWIIINIRIILGNLWANTVVVLMISICELFANLLLFILLFI